MKPRNDVKDHFFTAQIQAVVWKSYLNLRHNKNSNYNNSLYIYIFATQVDEQKIKKELK